MLTGAPVGLATALAFVPTHETADGGSITALPERGSSLPATGGPVARAGAVQPPPNRAGVSQAAQRAGRAPQSADRPSQAADRAPQAAGPGTQRAAQAAPGAPAAREPHTRQPDAPSSPGQRAGAPAPQAATTRASAPAARAAAANADPVDPAGWRQDFFDGFDAPIESTRWGRYGWDNGPVGNGAMGTLSVDNVFTSDGTLKLRTKYENGQWTSGGVSSGDFYAVSGGRWEIRARLPRAKGIGYVFLLYPNDGSWPPEIDIAEGRVDGPQVMGTYHWDADNKQESCFFDNPDMGGWHTYGVTIEGDRISYTFDGKPWGEVRNPNVTTKKLWVGFRAGAMDPNGSAKAYETVDGGRPNALTPADNVIEIDHVAHYTRA
ncbi:hypothetical protein GCM10027418_01190 [Mariniluteicoccus endophyticus]